MSGLTPRSGASRRSQRGFTLIELLVVIGVIAVLAVVVIGGLGGADKSTALRSAQATVSNAITAARTRAIAKGENVGVMIHHDARYPDRYRRCVVVAEKIGFTPVVVAEFQLPDGIGVLPHRDRFEATMRIPGDWTGGNSKEALGSTLFNDSISKAVGRSEVETWEYREFTANGTLAGGTAGSVIVGSKQKEISTNGEVRAIFVSPDQVRGMTVSVYGLARMINDRSGF